MSGDILDLVPGIETLSASARHRLMRSASKRRMGRGAILYRAGDRPDGLYIILEGRVRVSSESASRSQLLHSEGPGGILGEIPVFGGGAYPATAVAVEATVCLHLAVDAVDRLVLEEPTFARFAVKRIAARARSLLKRIDELTAETITSRVAAYLSSRAAESELAPFTLGMSQEALAQDLGTAREVVVRSLAALVEAGAIERAGRSRFVVRNLEILRSYR